jgi:NADH dehydrogenase FAD-containing subunit
LANQHWRVVVVEMLSAMARDLFLANRELLLKELSDRNVELVTNARVSQVDLHQIAVSTTEGDRLFDYDLLVLTIGRRPVDELVDIARKLVKDVYVIGDCHSPRKIKDAIWEAFKLGRIA